MPKVDIPKKVPKEVHSTKRIFSPDSYTLALRLWAEGYTPNMIAKRFEKEGKDHPSVASIAEMMKRKSNQEAIRQFKEVYYSRIMDVPVANKRHRLDVINKTVEEIRNTLTTLVQSGKIKKSSRKEYLSLAKRLTELLQRSQEELEKKPNLQVNVISETKTDEELIKYERRIDEELRRLKATSEVSLSPTGKSSDRHGEIITVEG